MPKFLPPSQDLETKSVLKRATLAHKALAELKGVMTGMPNHAILLSTLVLQEAKESSAVENIITTFDEMYRYRFLADTQTMSQTKEVHAYAEALKTGFGLLGKRGLLTNAEILQIQEIIECNHAGFRRQPGTKLIYEKTGEIVYEPPQTYDEILALMANLIDYVNDEGMHMVDPLIKMAIIHYQFESIHPFYNGKGRTGRILNILYLVKSGVLTYPILYMSKYIIKNKSEYYRLLRLVDTEQLWEPWILYMLDAIAYAAIDALDRVIQIKALMQRYEEAIHEKLPKIYSQNLVNNLFKYPYTKIDYLAEDIGTTRLTATKYLNQLVDHGFLLKRKHGRDVFYINNPLFRLLSEGE